MLILDIIKDMLSQNYRQFKMLILGIIIIELQAIQNVNSWYH